MTRAKAKPEEVWLNQDKWGSWDFSFDPPLKRYRHEYVRMVNEAEVARLKAEVKHLRAEMKETGKWLVDATVRKDWAAAAMARAVLEDAVGRRTSRK